MREITIDRVSNGGNLVPRYKPYRKIIENKVDGRYPSPGEIWEVRVVNKEGKRIDYEPVNFVREIPDYTSRFVKKDYGKNGYYQFEENEGNPFKTDNKNDALSGSKF